MSFTPGPWRVDDDNSKNVRAGGVGGLFVAKTYAIPIEYNQDDAYGREQLANARLIAVAPELYAAAKALVAEIFIDEDTEQDDPLITMRYIRQLRDAIAKAEGR